MKHRAQTHYLNTDFDVSLRPRPRQLERPAVVRQVRELSVQAILGAGDGDAVLLRAEVPDEFLDHLHSSGLDVPRLLAHPHVDPATRLNPFGWSDEAIALNRAQTDAVEHPRPETIRRVNGRGFAFELQRELVDDATGALAESVEEIERFLSLGNDTDRWVVKAEHGNSGLGNRRLDGPTLTEADRRFIAGRLEEDDRLLIEPWLPRERDWCAVFDVPFEPSAWRLHETVCTRDGALIGALFEPGEQGTAKIREELHAICAAVAARLVDAGYFGPACIDAFSWRDGERELLRPLVDLNCRQSMSACVHRLWQRRLADRSLFYRFFNRRKLDLPGELADLLCALGDDRYDPARRRGILPASPLELGSRGLPETEGLSPRASWRPGKLALIFVDQGRSGLQELECRFRDRFEA